MRPFRFLSAVLHFSVFLIGHAGSTCCAPLRDFRAVGRPLENTGDVRRVRIWRDVFDISQCSPPPLRSNTRAVGALPSTPWPPCREQLRDCRSFRTVRRGGRLFVTSCGHSSGVLCRRSSLGVKERERPRRRAVIISHVSFKYAVVRAATRNVSSGIHVVSTAALRTFAYHLHRKSIVEDKLSSARTTSRDNRRGEQQDDGQENNSAVAEVNDKARNDGS